jgi:gamma-glutamylcyclotransferase (GGCT)/AIG2-like uncharacterized protein YtfP
MPLVFAYGTLQQKDVQLSTFGRIVDTQSDALVGFEKTQVRIEDPAMAAELGRPHHANVEFVGNASSRVSGMALEVTDDELASVDTYEGSFSYKRVPATLASGREAWVYVHSYQTQ